MGYVYHGTEFDAHLPLPPLPDPEPRQHDQGTIKCGTRSGYVAHRRANEDACEPCKAANRAYAADYKERRRHRQIPKGWTGAKCGTIAGYSAHYRHAVPVCDPCKAANAKRARDRRERKQAA